MNTCQRFETEGLEAMERGEALHQHFSNCDDCIEQQRKHIALKNLLSSLNQGSIPSQDWQAKVLTAINTKEPGDTLSDGPLQDQLGPATTTNLSHFKSTNWLGAIAASITIFAIAALLIPQFGPSRSAQQHAFDELALNVISSSTTYRGKTSKVGDKLSITARVSEGQPHVQLRLYHDGRLYADCNSTLHCQQQYNSITATATLEANGDYQAVLVSNTQNTSLPDQRLDQDVTMARSLAAKVTVSDIVQVR